MKYILCWDIDGTLLTTNKAGWFAWEESARIILGLGTDIGSVKTDGRTDWQISAEIIKMQGAEPTVELVEKMVRLYERLLPDSLHRKTGGVLPGVKEVLDYYRSCKDCKSILLTGNTSAGAKAKLNHYLLSDYFNFGAYAEGLYERSEIARNAMGVIEQNFTILDPQKIFIIGDTPYDILCGQAIGANTIAVATGSYTKEQLEKYNPTLVLSCLPAPQVFADSLHSFLL